MSLVCEFQNPWFHIICMEEEVIAPVFYYYSCAFLCRCHRVNGTFMSVSICVCFKAMFYPSRALGTFHLLSAPPHPTPPPPQPQIMTEIWTLKFLLEFFVKRNPKGSFLWQHIWNICPKSQNLVCFFEEKTKPSYLKTCHPWGGGKK